MYKMLDILSRVADFTIFLALVTEPAGAYRAGPAETGRTRLSYSGSGQSAGGLATFSQDSDC